MTQPVWIDAERTVHAIRSLADTPGTALCGSPPRRLNGEQWRMRDNTGRGFEPFYRGSITCRWCRELRESTT